MSTPSSLNPLSSAVRDTSGMRGSSQPSTGTRGGYTSYQQQRQPSILKQVGSSLVHGRSGFEISADHPHSSSLSISHKSNTMLVPWTWSWCGRNSWPEVIMVHHVHNAAGLGLHRKLASASSFYQEYARYECAPWQQQQQQLQRRSVSYAHWHDR